MHQTSDKPSTKAPNWLKRMEANLLVVGGLLGLAVLLVVYAFDFQHRIDPAKILLLPMAIGLLCKLSMELSLSSLTGSTSRKIASEGGNIVDEINRAVQENRKGVVGRLLMWIFCLSHCALSLISGYVSTSIFTAAYLLF